MSDSFAERVYSRGECAVFRKATDPLGGLANMAGGYPLRVNGVIIHSSEALYQACRFPSHLAAQERVLAQKSPMTAKMVSKPFREHTRPDWEEVRVGIMRWVLRVKLICQWESFGTILSSTGHRPIVEDSHKDRFWGALPQEDGNLIGANVMGRLLMELREELNQLKGQKEYRLPPVPIVDFLLLGEPIRTIVRTLGKNPQKN